MRGVKTLSRIALLLIVLGALLFVCAMAAGGWDFSILSTKKLQTNEYNIDNSYSDISILADTADISFLIAEDGQSRVVCRESDKVKHALSAENGTLSIRVEDSRKWYECIGIFWESPKISVYLPKGEYGSLEIESDTSDVFIPSELAFSDINIEVSTGDVSCLAAFAKNVKITASTGDLTLSSMSAESVELAVSTGKIAVSELTCQGDISVSVSTGRASLTDVKCKNISSVGNTGDLTLTDLLAEGKVSVTRSTGDVSLYGCDAKEIFIETSTGDVNGSLMSEKIFSPKSSTGLVNVPQSAAGGICEIITSTGDIKITVNK